MSIRREMRGFLIGSLLFALGATPGYVGLVGVTADNLTYFLGSIFFTIAGFTQLRLTGRWQRGGWSDHDAWADWWAAAIQFLGTLAFNVSTLGALLGTIDPGTFERMGWRPDFIGSGTTSRFLTTGDPARVSSKATQFLRRKIAFEAA